MSSDQTRKEELDELKSRLDYCRTEDRHECALISNRMQWMLSCQGFLLGGYFTLSQGATSDKKSFLIGVICVLSARVAWIVRHAIKQAEEVIENIHALESKVFEDAEKGGLASDMSAYNRGRNWGSGKKDYHHINSFRCQSEIPWGFVAIWILLFVLSFGQKFGWIFSV